MKIFFTVYLILISLNAYAGPCCGGSAATPSLISTGERAKFALSYSSSKVIADVEPSALVVFRNDEDQTAYSSKNISGSFLINENWQLGLGAGMIAENTSDLALSTAYAFEETLFFMGKLSVPTGKSKYEVDLSQSVPSGAGVYQFSLGLTGIQIISRYDLSYALEISQGKSGSIGSQGAEIQIDPGLSSTVSVTAGYLFNPKWRSSFGIRYEHRMSTTLIKSNVETKTSQTEYWPTSIGLTYFPNAQLTLSANYNDETLFGPVQNTTLVRSISMGLNYRYF